MYIFLIINFNEQIKFIIYKSGGCLHDNISDEIINENTFISVESSFQKSWMEAYAWFRKFKVNIYINYFLLF